MYFDEKKSFATVQRTEDDQINTLEFLDAADSIVGIFVLLNASALKFVQSDLEGNIKRIRDKHAKSPEKYATLEAIVRDEATAAAGKSKSESVKLRDATQALLWLTRGLSLTCEALKRTTKDKEKAFSTCFQEAYDQTLKKYHGWLVQKGITAAMYACPKRSVLYSKLAGVEGDVDEKTEAKVNAELDVWMAALGELVEKIQKFYNEDNKNYGEGL